MIEERDKAKDRLGIGNSQVLNKERLKSSSNTPERNSAERGKSSSRQDSKDRKPPLPESPKQPAQFDKNDENVLMSLNNLKENDLEKVL